MEIIPNTIEMVENNKIIFDNKNITEEIIIKILNSVVSKKISSRTLKIASEFLNLRKN